MQLSVAEVHDSIATTRPDDECLVFRDQRFTWRVVAERTRRLANFLIARALGCHTDRATLREWESGQDHLAICLHSGNEYLESMLGAFTARVAPFNVNYRYMADELRYILQDADATAIVIHSQFSPTLAEVRDDLPSLRVVLQVADSSGNPLLPGVVWYEEALASSHADPPPVPWSPDDLYILYTGGTTGVPKGVLWRNGDANIECFGVPADATIEQIAHARTPVRALLLPPFMHGAGHWVALRTWHSGGTVVVPSSPDRLDAAETWRTVERERITFLLVVGDAFARPLLDELARGDYDASSLTVLLSGGAPLTANVKDEFSRRLPTLLIVDGLGSSEAGGQLIAVSAGPGATTGRFPPAPGNEVLSATLDRVLEPGDNELGWLAKRGRLALGYLGDAAKTQRTYPTIDGVRYAVPGDRARLLADGTVELHGRDAATINSGGEKIFAEEVEAAMKRHDSVYDCVVTGRPSARWGNEVVAIVRLRQGATSREAELLAEAERHIARFKLPKAVIFVSDIVRSPSGKPDYRWAARVAARDSAS